MYKGADISSEDGAIFLNVVASSLDFVIPREGYGTHSDLSFYLYVREAKTAGLKVPAVYHTIENIDYKEVKKEAVKCLRRVGSIGLPKSTVVFGEIDYELIKYCTLYSRSAISELAFDIVETWINTVEKAGYKPGILVDMKNYFKIGQETREIIRSEAALWLVDTNGDPSIPCAVHKYSHRGLVDGMKRDVEMNLWYDDDLYHGVNANVPAVIDEEIEEKE